MPDSIVIRNLELQAQLGVPDAERAEPQRLQATLELWPDRGFDALDDSIVKTVDYALVCASAQAIVAERPRNLLETVADDLANRLLSGFALAAIAVEVRKFILPETEFVAVRVERTHVSAADPAPLNIPHVPLS